RAVLQVDGGAAHPRPVPERLLHRLRAVAAGHAAHLQARSLHRSASPFVSPHPAVRGWQVPYQPGRAPRPPTPALTGLPRPSTMPRTLYRRGAVNELPNLTVLGHPLIQHKLTILRDRETSKKKFKEVVDEIAMLMAYEVTKDLVLEDVA